MQRFDPFLQYMADCYLICHSEVRCQFEFETARGVMAGDPRDELDRRAVDRGIVTYRLRTLEDTFFVVPLQMQIVLSALTWRHIVPRASCRDLDVDVLHAVRLEEPIRRRVDMPWAAPHVVSVCHGISGPSGARRVEEA